MCYSNQQDTLLGRLPWGGGVTTTLKPKGCQGYCRCKGPRQSQNLSLSQVSNLLSLLQFEQCSGPLTASGEDCIPFAFIPPTCTPFSHKPLYPSGYSRHPASAWQPCRIPLIFASSLFILPSCLPQHFLLLEGSIQGNSYHRFPKHLGAGLGSRDLR